MPQVILHAVPSATYSQLPRSQTNFARRKADSIKLTCRASTCESSAVASSAIWTEFSTAVSGEWSGITATFSNDGEAQELPYQYVPAAFREWNMVPKDWHTQNSTLASDDGLLTKLKRLMPIVGCEADAVAFHEDERRSLRSDERHCHEDKTVLRDGSYSSGPRSLVGSLTARIEHCVVTAESERWRGVFHVQRANLDSAWQLKDFEVHSERRTGDYDGGVSLEACGYNQTDVSGQPATTAEQLAGPWVSNSQADFELDSSGGFTAVSTSTSNQLDIPEEGRLLLPGGCWCSVVSSEGDHLRAEFGWLSNEVCKVAIRSFKGGRLDVQSFVTGQR